MEVGKVKIVFVINNFFMGGVERLMLDILSGLDKSKFSIELVTILGFGPLEAEFRQLGIPIHSVGSQLGAKYTLPFKLFWIALAPITLLRLWWIVLKMRPHVVVTSLYQADLLGIFAATLAGVKKRVVIQHDVVYFSWLLRLFKNVFSLKLAITIVAVSETTKTFLVERWQVPENKVVVINSGVDFASFSRASRREGLLKRNDLPIVGMLGRLEPIKGPDVLLGALRLLKIRYGLEPAVLMGGSGAMQSQLEQYAKKHNLSKIQFLGQVTDRLEFLKQVDIFVVPSLSEGFGLSALEGLASHKVVIASNLEALEEFVIHNKNGLIFPKGDCDQLASTIALVLKDSHKRELLRKGTVSWLRSYGAKFDIRATVESYEKLLIDTAAPIAPLQQRRS